MRLIGLIGGCSYVSTLAYYEWLNKEIARRTNGADRATCLIYSVNFGDQRRNNDAGNEAANSEIFRRAAVSLQAGGAQAIAICANTPHEWAGHLTEATGLPLIHIGDAVAKTAVAQGFRKVALLGTHYTMERAFMIDAYRKGGLEVVVPEADDRAYISGTIYGEFANDVYTDEARANYLAILGKLKAEGCDAAALACTEIPHLLRGIPSPLPTLDSVRIHVEAIADAMLAN